MWHPFVNVEEIRCTASIQPVIIITIKLRESVVFHYSFIIANGQHCVNQIAYSEIFFIVALY